MSEYITYTDNPQRQSTTLGARAEPKYVCTYLHVYIVRKLSGSAQWPARDPGGCVYIYMSGGPGLQLLISTHPKCVMASAYVRRN